MKPLRKLADHPPELQGYSLDILRESLQYEILWIIYASDYGDLCECLAVSSQADD